MRVLEYYMASPYQDRVWIDQTGKEWRLEEMEPRHRANLIAWMERHAFAFHDRECSRMALGPRPQGDMAQYEFDRSFDELLDTDPLEWLRSTPLYQRLVELDHQEANAG